MATIVKASDLPRSTRPAIVNPFTADIKELASEVDADGYSVNGLIVDADDYPVHVYADGTEMPEDMHVRRLRRLVQEAARDLGYTARLSTITDYTFGVRLAPRIIRKAKA